MGGAGAGAVDRQLANQQLMMPYICQPKGIEKDGPGEDNPGKESVLVMMKDFLAEKESCQQRIEKGGKFNSPLLVGCLYCACIQHTSLPLIRTQQAVMSESLPCFGPAVNYSHLCWHTGS